MTEAKIIYLLTAGVFLWIIGGTYWRPAKVWVWPLSVALVLHSLAGLGAAALLVFANSLPYGDRTPWGWKAVVFFLLGLAPVALDAGFGVWWALGSMLLLLWIAYLSVKINRVTWKVWEALAGFLQAVGLVIAGLR